MYTYTYMYMYMYMYRYVNGHEAGSVGYHHSAVRAFGPSQRRPPPDSAADGYGEEGVMFTLALTAEPVLAWAARRVRRSRRPLQVKTLILEGTKGVPRKGV